MQFSFSSVALSEVEFDPPGVRDVWVKKTASQVVPKRNLRKFDAERFLGDSTDLDWSYMGQFDDVEVALDSFVTAFNYFVNKLTPYKRTTIKARVVPRDTHELSTRGVPKNLTPCHGTFK